MSSGQTNDSAFLLRTTMLGRAARCKPSSPSPLRSPRGSSSLLERLRDQLYCGMILV